MRGPIVHCQSCHRELWVKGAEMLTKFGEGCPKCSNWNPPKGEFMDAEKFIDMCRGEQQRLTQMTHIMSHGGQPTIEQYNELGKLASHYAISQNWAILVLEEINTNPYGIGGGVIDRAIEKLRFTGPPSRYTRTP